MSRSRLTAQSQAAIVARIELGVSLPDAATAAGVRPETVKSWMARGRREGEGRYADFVEAIERAREQARSRPEPMDEDELAVAVSEQARAGSVQALKLRWDMLRAEPKSDEDSPGGSVSVLAEMDELAAKRRRRGA